METEPILNADLAGYTWDFEGLTFTVTGPTSWSPQYVDVEVSDGSRTCRQAGLIRRAIELDKERDGRLRPSST